MFFIRLPLNWSTWLFSICTNKTCPKQEIWECSKPQTVPQLSQVYKIFYVLAVWPNELLLANRMDGLHNRQSLELRHSIMQKCLTNYPQEWFNFRFILENDENKLVLRRNSRYLSVLNMCYYLKLCMNMYIYCIYCFDILQISVNRAFPLAFTCKHN